MQPSSLASITSSKPAPPHFLMTSKFVMVCGICGKVLENCVGIFEIWWVSLGIVAMCRRCWIWQGWLGFIKVCRDLVGPISHRSGAAPDCTVPRTAGRSRAGRGHPRGRSSSPGRSPRPRAASVRTKQRRLATGKQRLCLAKKAEALQAQAFSRPGEKGPPTHPGGTPCPTRWRKGARQTHPTPPLLGGQSWKKNPMA